MQFVTKPLTIQVISNQNENSSTSTHTDYKWMKNNVEDLVLV